MNLSIMDDNFSIKKQNIRTLSLVVVTLIYLLTGAVVFDQLESSTEERSKQNLTNHIKLFRSQINISDVEFERLYKHILRRAVHKKDMQWSFLGSFFFCTMAVALIGYGHSTPKTKYGRLFCIFYICGGKLIL
jgi:potassium channel subfamily K protein 9